MNKKLIYRRDSAHRRLLRRSKSIKVTNGDISRKPVCNFIWVDDINLILSRTVFQLSLSICQITIFDKRMPLVNAIVLGNLLEYCHGIYHIKKTRFFGLHFCRKQYGSKFNHFNVIGPEIMAITLFKVIQGHQFVYQSEAHMRLPISQQYKLTSYFAPFPSYCRLLIKFWLSIGGTSL